MVPENFKVKQISNEIGGKLDSIRKIIRDFMSGKRILTEEKFKLFKKKKLESYHEKYILELYEK